MNNKELELEAEKYGYEQYGNSCGAKQERKNCIEDFVAGATSKYVEKQKLEFAMLMLNRAKDLDIKTVYFELQQKLKEL